MKIRKKYIVAIIFSILSVVSLNSLNSIFSIIPQKRLPLEEDGTTISWTLAGVQGGIPDPVDISRIIDVTEFAF
ncbi:MAG: hypothetical protein PHY08_06475 [Candidatus Cloacimonetes bacterium]|nr:hypothetical protein [Candidatus Cloacimonadota bacterium]